MLNYTYDGAGRLTREDNKGLDRTVRYAYDGARLVRTYCEMGTRLAEVPDFGYDAQSNSFVDTDYERRVCFGCVRKVCALAPLAACCLSELAFRLLDGLSTILWKHKVGEEWEEHEYIVRRNILGDVTQLYDTLGNLCVQYRYDAWGQVYPITIFDYHGIARVNPILYRGYVYDKETELYYLNSRYYDPETGRFLNADSLEYLEPESVYGINLYAYCANDPVNLTDRTGTNWWTDFWNNVKTGWDNFTNSTVGKVLGWVATGLITGLAVAGVIAGTFFTGGLLGAVMLGAGLGALAGMSVSITSQGGFKNANPWKVAGSGIVGGIIGGATGAFSYGLSVVGQSLGQTFGLTLSSKTFLGYKIARVFSTGFLMGVGKFAGGIAGGFIGSLMGDYFVSTARGEYSTFDSLFLGALDGEATGWIADLIKWLRGIA